MLKLHTLKAEHGDCLILEFCTSGGKSKFILIDGGPESVFDKFLEPFLKKLKKKIKSVPVFDLVVLSHSDNDHAGGLLKLVEKLQFMGFSRHPLMHIKEFWHNDLKNFNTLNKQSELNKQIELKLKKEPKNRSRSLSDENSESDFIKKSFDQFGDKLLQEFLAPNEVRGYKEGSNLAKKIEDELNIVINKRFGKHSMITTEISNPRVEIDNLRLEIIGPSKKYLQKLMVEWSKWVTKNADKLRQRTLRGVSMDYSPLNLSSIMFLVEADEKTILFTGDGRGRHIIEGLKKRKLLDKNDTIEVDVLKLPHHGSNRNVKKEFFDKVLAKNYIVSGNDRYDNPHADTLTMIAKAAKKQKRKVKIFVTYNNTCQIREFRKRCPKKDYTYEIKTVKRKENFFTIALS